MVPYPIAIGKMKSNYYFLHKVLYHSFKMDIMFLFNMINPNEIPPQRQTKYHLWQLHPAKVADKDRFLSTTFV